VSAFLRRGDFWSGLALAVLGTYIVSEARGWIYMGEDGPGPGFFPLWYGGAMIVLSLLLVAGTVAKPGAAGRRTSRPELLRALLCWGAFVACVALMNVLGFALAYAMLTWFIVAVMARRPQRIALAVAVGGAILFHLLFDVALDVGLPRGIWF
jgi:putative tricarboxylic transport membrane protein